MSESALSVYLRSVAHLYPGGIPKAAVKAAPQSSADRPRVLFLSCEVPIGEPGAAGAGVWSDPAGLLLRAAIEKGLKVPVEAAEVVRSQEKQKLKAAYEASACVFVVCLGRDAVEAIGWSGYETGALSAFGGKQLLCTIELSRSVSDASAKRQFWQDLQPLLAAL